MVGRFSLFLVVLGFGEDGGFVIRFGGFIIGRKGLCRVRRFVKYVFVFWIFVGFFVSFGI